MIEFKIPNRQTYHIKNIDKIKTPSLVVFKGSVLKNINLMKSYLQEISPKSGFKNLCPHVKTNKSSYITKQMLNAGINFFKCTPNEVQMLIDCGVKNMFIAYPLLRKDAEKIADLIYSNPDLNFYIQVGNIDQAIILNTIAINRKIIWDYFIDIDVGMNRTGIVAEKVFQLFKSIEKLKNFNLIGLHGYDGHNHEIDDDLRKKISSECMNILVHLYNEFETNGIKVEKVMAAGSPSFQLDLIYLFNSLQNNVEIYISPGTWIYWDSKYDSILPNKFEFAALVLAQVMDVGNNRITLNLGHKRWASDQGGIELFSQEGLNLKSFSEEHTVLSTNKSSQYKIGDYILIVPRHVCPTVNLYENFTLIGKDGEIENLSTPIDARNR
jgi:D-serine deaminase-like pyridoxal phosphate-dependent protein